MEEETAQSPEQFSPQPESVVTPEIPPVPTKSKPWLKIFLFSVLGIVVVSALIFGAYKFGQRQAQSGPQPAPTPAVVATPTPDSTANWKTYTSSDFRIKYPTDWEVRDLLPKNRNLEWLKTSSLYLGLAPISIKEDVLGGIRVTSDGVKKVVADTKNVMLAPGVPTRLLSETEAWLNNYSATKLVFENTIAQVKNQILIIPQDKKTYILSGGGSKDTSTIDLILSTFEFLPSTSPSATSSGPSGSGQGE